MDGLIDATDIKIWINLPGGTPNTVGCRFTFVSAVFTAMTAGVEAML